MKTPLDDVRVTLLLARLSHEAWRLFDGPHAERSAILEVRNRYRDFLVTVEEALLTTFVVKLASLFGTHRDEITLHMLPGVDQDPEFNDVWDRGRRLHKYRSNAIAHRNRAVTSHDFARDTGFTYDDLKRLLDDTCALFDRVAVKHGARGVLDVSCEGDFIQMIHDLTASERI